MSTDQTDFERQGPGQAAPLPPLPVPRNPRYLTLDTWRGLACLMVVVFHATHHIDKATVPGGSIAKVILAVTDRLSMGVTMFFVISGYCIAATSDASRRKPRAPWRYFTRRFRRIFPPYWAVVLISIVVVVAFTAVGQADLVTGDYAPIPDPASLSWSQWVGNLTLTETWRPHLFGGPERKIVSPSWTLCYEEQFYAVCGLLLIVAPRGFFAGTAVVTVATIAVAFLAHFNGWATSITGFFFDGGWLPFALGIAVYYVLNYAKSRRPGVILISLLFASCAAIRWKVPAVAADEALRNQFQSYVVMSAFALGLILLHPWDRQFAGSRLLRPVRGCGQMCYSLYLVHCPITVVMTAAFERAGVRDYWPRLLITAPSTITASIAASWLFYLAVERRFLNAPNVPVGRPIDATPASAKLAGDVTA